MIQRSINGCSARAVILAASLLALAGLIRAGNLEETGLVHVQGRVSINLPENGSFSLCRREGGPCGIMWPRVDGAEFLGTGGFFLRFRRAAGATYDLVSPGAFEALDAGMRARAVYEGCEGGKRYPHRDRDDDGDGATDEDPLDGLDNDRDGLVDEDFAAIGDGMVVTRAVEPFARLVMRQRSYSWNYGHVRDFVGFTTSIEYPAEAAEREEEVRDLALALYMDFNIGNPENERRGADDRFFFLGDGAGDGGVERTFELPVAADGLSSAFFAAVIVLDATGPGGVPLDVDGFIMGVTDRPDTLWTRFLRAGRGSCITAREDSYGAAGDRTALPPEKLSSYGAVDGDRAIVHRIGTVPRMIPGDRVTVEWALVFGRSEDALVKNIRRAVETFRGVTEVGGMTCRWVVPARRAARREFTMTLASVWTEEKRRPAAAVAIPADLESEEVEWIRVDGNCTTLYERVGAKIVLPLERELIAREEPFAIEGQLTDGTIFTAKPSSELLRAYGASGDLPPDRLPDGSLHMYPNPFLTSLTIDVNVSGTTAYANSTAANELEGTSSVRVYDVKGRLVRTVLQEEILHPGSYQLDWNGLDENGAKVAPGVYYCKLQIGVRSLTKRVILLR
ncbi:MAG TPA: FlgD immunoglobulin-like domain containing protein [Patescibacteria group bacterium]|nr:FlgD immunoglobulin-like domain containing protein [Patescibacteria group bacterium]